MNVRTTVGAAASERASVLLVIEGSPDELRRALASLTSGRESPEYNTIMADLILVLARAVAVNR